jgi:hypothetical protein
MIIESIADIKSLPLPALGLLGAVHDASVANVADWADLDEAGLNDGQVFRNTTGESQALPAQKNWPAQNVPNSGYWADQHGLLYPVVPKVGTSSFYPRVFERNLYTLAFTPNALPLRTLFELNRLYQFRMFSNNTDAVWNVVWEIGMRVDATSPGTPGPNIATYDWRQPLIDAQVHITDVETSHQFGVWLRRDLDGTDEIWTGGVRQYGMHVAAHADALPTGNDFVLRLRLGQFDILDDVTNPRGYVAYFVMDPEKEKK